MYIYFFFPCKVPVSKAGFTKIQTSEIFTVQFPSQDRLCKLPSYRRKHHSVGVHCEYDKHLMVSVEYSWMLQISGLLSSISYLKKWSKQSKCYENRWSKNNCSSTFTVK